MADMGPSTTITPALSAPLRPEAEADALARAAARLADRTAAQIRADRERLLALTPAPRPLPDGKTLAEVVEGSWPGDESDAAVAVDLARLS